VLESAAMLGLIPDDTVMLHFEAKFCQKQIIFDRGQLNFPRCSDTSVIMMVPGIDGRFIMKCCDPCIRTVP
jgi:hypothetical protein